MLKFRAVQNEIRLVGTTMGKTRIIIKTEAGGTNTFVIKKGVKQGRYIVSHTL